MKLIVLKKLVLICFFLIINYFNKIIFTDLSSTVYYLNIFHFNLSNREELS
jgi:hypothetical protein